MKHFQRFGGAIVLLVAAGVALGQQVSPEVAAKKNEREGLAKLIALKCLEDNPFVAIGNHANVTTNVQTIVAYLDDCFTYIAVS